ncbi:3'-5' exonuclease [Haliea sp.]|jgi:DNA polymerase-3 subunit epsilon|uniref:3'-5' exonuclease n=1 Tax=Haliea sp. TaxID=1932666 RepID=UPI000C675F3A|nr:3'-5' exonuclease [Haliea sp.]MAD65476.1 DNA polymerase III subunit epsilon [Haliea sp.]MAY91487.1 DNA polymerase III subunit epsilon [Haliea sp.]MBP68385.1 DNA polymerase III subunit epsilon [Haliea sp.]|tara:strand:- start:14720 stop:15313 length:594 start_codon:yes stop_codon:yes gene_type:complete
MYKELLWIFTQLPDDYIVLDTETTGLPDENGPPDIVTLGITVVRNRKIAESVEFKTRPQKRISEEAQRIHGITNEQAAEFAAFDSQWNPIADYLKDQLIVIHNASFDWPILLDHVARYGLSMPPVQGVFCSQKAAIPWAQATDLSCSHRGPSLDALTKALGIEDLRSKINGIHGAEIDSQQAAQVAEVMRSNGNKLR